MEETNYLGKYVKVVYESKPIGKEKIVLYLTTFDWERYELDQECLKQQAITFELPPADSPSEALATLEKILNDYVKRYYEPYVKELREVIHTKKVLGKAIDLNAKNISNAGDVHCNMVYGNITNCDNVYCTEIKGNVVNCDKIVYKRKVSNNEKTGI